MRIKEGKEWKTALQTWYGYFEYQVMSFGLTNLSESFQSYINKILAEIDIVVIIYLDNILIYTKDLEKGHIKAIQWVLEVFQKYGLYANLKKCHFHQDEIKFLGFIVSMDGIRIKRERIDVIKKWPELKSVQDI